MRTCARVCVDMGYDAPEAYRYRQHGGPPPSAPARDARNFPRARYSTHVGVVHASSVPFRALTKNAQEHGRQPHQFGRICWRCWPGSRGWTAFPGPEAWPASPFVGPARRALRPRLWPRILYAPKVAVRVRAAAQRVQGRLGSRTASGKEFLIRKK